MAHGAKVTVVARGAEALQSVRARLGVASIAADVTDETAAHRILAEVRPDILALNAGATPPMGRLDQLSWADFSAPWEHDVKAGLYWLQKPVECMKRPIENNSKRGDAIYEPFSGSGTTIIAGEMTGRRVLAIELSPVYVDVAVLRWQNFTGREATLEATGKTFAEMAAERRPTTSE